jgi:hypothetical protein
MGTFGAVLDAVHFVGKIKPEEEFKRTIFLYPLFGLP